MSMKDKIIHICTDGVIIRFDSDVKGNPWLIVKDEKREIELRFNADTFVYFKAKLKQFNIRKKQRMLKVKAVGTERVADAEQEEWKI